VFGFVAFAAEGDGGEEGGVSFGDDGRKGYMGKERGLQGILKCYGAVDAEEEALGGEFEGLVEGAGEGVEDGFEAVVVVGADEGHDFVEGVADVDEGGLIAFEGPVELGDEGVLLLGEVGFVPVEVEADFADAGKRGSVEGGVDLSELLLVVFADVAGVEAGEEAEHLCETEVGGAERLHGA